MIMYGVSFIIFLFVSFSLFFRAAMPGSLKILGTLLILFASLKFVIYQVIGGAFFSPGLPRLFIIFMEALYGALLLLFFLLILWDSLLFILWILGKCGLKIPRLPCGAIKCLLVLCAICSGCWGTWQAIKVPETREFTAWLPNLPEDLEGFSIVQLSDLHIGPILKKDWLEQVVAEANSLDGDLIALTGDYVDGHVSEIASELAPLANLSAKYGVFAVSGNHEYYWNVTEWEDALAEMGLPLMVNTHKVLDVNGHNLIIAGVPDLAAERFGFEGPNLEKALKNAPEGVRILLAHQPKPAPSWLEQADLQLSGHTHGGLMFFLRPLVAFFNNGYVVGNYDINGKLLYVNPGTGLWNGFSCRIGNPAEITKIILKRQR